MRRPRKDIERCKALIGRRCQLVREVRLREAAPWLLAALHGLGAKPEDYCFCTNAEQVTAGHTGECREACAAIEKATRP